MIFVSEEPLTENGILLALSEDGVEKTLVRECMKAIESEWSESSDRGIQICCVAGGYQFRTKVSCAEWLKRLNVPKPMRLSGPALETLAIVAYKQPIVRSEIEKIRGVDSGGVLKTLLERRLLRIVGRRDEPGQPLLYGTTKEFLEIFNLKTLGELPTLRDIEDLLREHRTKTDSKPLSMESDDEEPTEVIENVEDEDEEKEEEAELINRYPLDEDQDVEKKDMDALSDLEQNLKSLRRLERNIFPKPLPQAGELAPGGVNAAEAVQGIQAGEEEEGGEVVSREEASERSTSPDEAPGEDASSADDRPRE